MTQQSVKADALLSARPVADPGLLNQNIWTKRSGAPPPRPTRFIAKKSASNAVARAALLSWLVTAGLFFSLGVGAIMYRNEVVKLWPQAGSIYKQIGFNVNRFGLDFEDIQRSRTFNDTVPVVTVAGKALNISRSTVDTPAVRVDLKDEIGAVVATKYGRIRPDQLAAGESGTFQVVVEQAPMESFEIELKFVDLSDMPPRDDTPDPTTEDLMATETETPAE